jgi:O-antigen ligase
MLGSHDMMADFCSMMFPAHMYFLYRSRGNFGRLIHGVLAVLSVVVLLMTSNRGGIVGMGAGILYGLWLLRHQLTWLSVGIVSSLGLGIILALDTILSSAGRTLSVFRRIATTKFYGLLPETRVGVWEHFKSRVSEHFWLGEGPFYRLARRDASEYVFWPHNAFGYYWVTVGMLGMFSFIALCVQILRKSAAERARRLGDTYPREVLLVLHVMVVVFIVTQQRTDFQRGHVFTYFVFMLFGFTMGVWSLARSEAEAEDGPRA